MPRKEWRAAPHSDSKSGGTSCTREKFATPKTDAILSRSRSQGSSSGASRETRPAPTRTATVSRSDVARRRLSASFVMKKGRFLPFRPIS